MKHCPIARCLLPLVALLPVSLVFAAKPEATIEEKKYFADLIHYEFYIREYKTKVTLDPARVIPAPVRAGYPPELTAIDVLGAISAGAIERFFEYVPPAEKARLEEK